jgi:hypothetical protein
VVVINQINQIYINIVPGHAILRWFWLVELGQICQSLSSVASSTASSGTVPFFHWLLALMNL